MSEARTSAAVLVVACSAFISLALAQANGEISPYFASGVSGEGRYAAVIAGNYRPGLSLWSKDLFLRDCLADATSIFSRAQLPRRRAAFLGACRDVAKSLALGMPTYARAFLVAATAEIELGQEEAFRVDLRQAVRTAPAVHWLAERRSALAERHLPKLDNAGLDDWAADILTLLESPSGQRVVARRYVGNAGRRPSLAAVVERARPELQSGFLSQVNAAVAAGGK